MKLICKNCQREFDLRNAEYNRQVKKGRPKDHFFCNNVCSGVYFNSNGKYLVTEKRAEHLLKIQNMEKRRGYSTNKYLNKESPRFNIYVSRAKARIGKKCNKFLEFSITEKYLQEIWENQNGKCPYTGLELRLRKYKDKANEEEYDMSVASLDRIDSSKGYIVGNVQFVSVMYNMCKNIHSDEKVAEFIKITYEHMFSNKLKG